MSYFKLKDILGFPEGCNKRGIFSTACKKYGSNTFIESCSELG